MKKRILALGLAIALIFNTVDFSTVAAAAAVEEQQIEEQTEEQKQEPADDSLEEPQLQEESSEEQKNEDSESNAGITDADTGLEDSENKDSETDAAVVAVQEMINALPDVDALDDMESDELEKAYADTQTAYEAYEALTEEQQEQLTGADCFEKLFDWFNGQISVLADETESNVAEVTVGSATKQYTDIDAAFEAAQNADSATVKLLADVTISHDDYSGIMMKEGNITLDLNGKTLSKSERDDNDFLAKNAVFWLVGGSLTIRDNSTGENGKIVQPNGGPAIIVIEAALTVESGTVESTSSDDFDDEFHSRSNCAVLVDSDGKAVIKGGTLSGMHGAAVTGMNDTYGSLTVTGGTFTGTSGNALIVYGGTAQLSGGTFRVTSNEHSIWVADGKASNLLVNGYRFESNGTECAYSEDGKGVVGNATVAQRPANEYAYIDKDGKLTTQANCTEITENTEDISTQGWYVLKEDITISLLDISEEVNLILCDGATLTVSGYMNVTDGCTLNLYWQSAGSGKLTAADINVSGTITAPAGEMKKTAGEGGTTYEKCLTHEWNYKDNEGDTHTATCMLCGKDGGTVAHKFNNLESTTETTHTYSCVCGKTKTDNHPSLSESPNADGLTHTGRCGICGYSTEPENHDFQYYGMCSCFACLTATSGGQSYASLASAVAAAAKNDGTVILQKNVAENITITDGMDVTIDLNGKEWETTYDGGNKPALTVDGGSVTVKNGTIQTGGMASACTPVEINGGSLTVDAGMTIQGNVWTDNQYYHAIEVKGGQLTLSVGTKLEYGMKVADGKTLADYLPEEAAFQQTDYDQEAATTGTDGIINGYVQEKIGNFELSVVKHKMHQYDATTHKCECGFTCAHEKFNNGVCETCGYVCAHPSDKVTEETDETTCSVCKEQMVVKVEKDDSTTYYAERHNDYNDETLWWLFNNALESGSTVTLLADDLLAWAYVSKGKTITLDLNGKTLGETSQGITVGQGNAEDKSINNKLIVKGALGIGETTVDGGYAFRTWVGGELDLVGMESGGKIGGIIADGGKVTTGSSNTDIKIGTLDINNNNTELSFSIGTFDKITGNGGKILGDLLANENLIQKSGKAFKHIGDGGAFVPYNTEISNDKSVENVTIVTCPHNNITDDENGCTCNDCGMTTIAAVLTQTDGGIKTYTINDSTDDIFNALTNNGGTLKLYCDFAHNGNLGQKNGTTEMMIDLNGHEINLPTGAAGQDVVLNGGQLTITDSGSGKKGRFAATLRVYYTASLTVDGVAMGTIGLMNGTANITLKAGTTFTGYVKPSGMILAQWIEDGDCISGVNIADTTNDNGSGNFTVTKAPATITEGEKNGTIHYGTDRLPNEMYPAIALDKNSPLNTNVDKLQWAWTCIVNGTTYTLFNGTYTEADGYMLGFDSLWNKNVISAGDELNVTFTLSASTSTNNTAWSTVLTGYTLTVTKGTSQVTQAPTAKTDLTYNGSPQALVTAGKANGGEMQYSTDGTSYSTDIPTGTDAMDYIIWYKAVGDQNHNDSQPQSLKVTIGPKTVDTPTIEVTSGSVYDGKGQTPGVVVKDGKTEIPESEYTVSYSDNVNAGENTAIVTITDKEGGNYTVNGSTNFMIAKAAAPQLNAISKSRKYIENMEQSLSLTDIGMPTDAGTLSYSKGDARTDGSVTVSSWDVDGTGKVTYTLANGKIGETVTLPVTIHSTNYADTTVNVVITLAEKDTPDVKADDITVNYTGIEVSAGRITGTATFNGETVPGSWSWKSDHGLTHVSDSGKKTVIFTPDDETNYESVETEIRLTINQRSVTIVNTAVAQTKVYDGTTVAEITDYGNIMGCWGGDNLTIATDHAKATYTDTDAGTGKTVTFSGFALSGNDQNDYVLSAQPESVKADITPKELTLTGTISAVDRAYAPGNTTVTVNSDSLVLSGFLGNETVNVSVHEGTLADADVGENKTVTCLPVLTDGENGGKAINYKVVTMPAVTVNITKAAGSITAPTAIGNLVYNGNQQTLIKAGSSVTGEVQYRLGEDGTYSTSLPTAKDVGTYTVYYKVVGDKNHEDVAEASLQVAIATQTSSESHTNNTTKDTANDTTATSQPVVSTPETSSAPAQPKTGSSPVKAPEADRIGATEQTNAQEPYVSGDEGKSGWDQIKDEIWAVIREVQTQNQQTEDSEPVTVTVNMNGATVVPGEIFDSIKDQNISVTFDMGAGILWTVNGMDIIEDQIKDIDFGVSMGAEAGKNIPVDIINNVTGERSSMNLTLNYDGTFGFRAVLTVNVEKTNEGLFANLFYYNPESGELEFICADEIRADGSVDLTFTHASDYLVVIDREPMDGTVTGENDASEDSMDAAVTDTTEPEPTSGNVIWIVLLVIAVILAGAGAVFVWKSKDKKTEE